MYIAERAADEFYAWVKFFDPGGNRCDPGGTLQGYINDWLKLGKGIDSVGGDFGTFLQAVIIITQRWIEEPSLVYLHYYEPDGNESVLEREPGGVYDTDYVGDMVSERDMVFERDYFETLVFQRVNGSRG